MSDENVAEDAPGETGSSGSNAPSQKRPSAGSNRASEKGASATSNAASERGESVNEASVKSATSNAASNKGASATSNAASNRDASATSNAPSDKGGSATCNAASNKGASATSNAVSGQGGGASSEKGGCSAPCGGAPEKKDCSSVSQKRASSVEAERRTSVSPSERRASTERGSWGEGIGVIIIVMITKMREPLAEYQCSTKGISKYEHYSFLNLVSVLCLHMYNSLLTIMTMLYNLTPLLDAFAYSLRFVLDKLIEICETTSTRDKIFKSFLFLGELVIVTIMLFFIISIVLLPALALTKHLVDQILGLFRKK